MLGYILNDPLAEITTTLVVGYGSFVLAESTGLYTSGVLAMVGGWMGSVCVCACRSIGTQPDPLYPTSPTDIHSTNPRICIRIHLHTHILHTHTHTHTQHTPPSTNNNLTPWQSSTTQVIAGLYMSFYGRGRISARVRAELNSFWAMLGYVANSLIFFVAGLQMIMRGACVSLLKWGPVCPSPCPFPLSLIPPPPPTHIAGLDSDYIHKEDWGYCVGIYLLVNALRFVGVFFSYPVLRR